MAHSREKRSACRQWRDPSHARLGDGEALDLNEAMTSGICPSPAEAVAIAEAVVGSRFKGASFAFVAGSILRGQGVRHSDIDLVVLFDKVDAAWRESFFADGVPVEAFVHDAGTLARFVDADVARGCPSILNMIVEGVVVGEAKANAETLRQTIGERLAAGPPPLTESQLNALRYEIGDAVDDLRADRPASETLSLGAALYPKLAELALRGRGRWNGTGKWASRLLSALDPALAASFEAAFRELFVSGETGAVIKLAEAELSPHGGPLFDGDKRLAPPSWRV